MLAALGLLLPAGRARARWPLAGSRGVGMSSVGRVYQHASSGDLQAARSAMDLVSARDVGFDPAARAPAGGPIEYRLIYHDERFSMAIFFLPQGACIPLHDHPQMTVLSKILFGELRVTAYDMPELGATTHLSPAHASACRASAICAARKASRPTSFFSRRKPTVLKCSSPQHATVSAPCDTLRLDPCKGNIHRFEALADTAILDVLSPPYDDRAGRSCHYYRVQSEEEGGVTELVEIDWPPELRIDADNANATLRLDASMVLK
ncbi:MAG: hypothetical protein SGPRY_008100 [Prymnesium sp.]